MACPTSRPGRYPVPVCHAPPGNSLCSLAGDGHVKRHFGCRQVIIYQAFPQMEPAIGPHLVRRGFSEFSRLRARDLKQGMVTAVYPERDGCE